MVNVEDIGDEQQTMKLEVFEIGSPGWSRWLNARHSRISEITDEVIRLNMACASRYSGYSVRLATGRVWTTQEYEQRKQEVLSTPLP